MSEQAISGHGSLISFQSSPGGAWTEVAELGDLTPPQLSRNTFDVTNQNDDIDAYIAGVLRRSEVTFPISLLLNDTSHDEAVGLQSLIIANTRTGFKFSFPDGTNWIFSGMVSQFAPTNPVDGPLRANVTVRPSGPMILRDGSVASPVTLS